MRIFVAGATGAVGRPLVKQLLAKGYDVSATTRSAAKADQLRRMGVTAFVVDGLDGAAIGEAVARAEPDAMVHQMTALSAKPDLKHFDSWFADTNELRTKGTEHLLAAAVSLGVQRFIIQSYTGWNNAREGGPIKTEEDPLDPHPAPSQRETMATIHHLEKVVAEAPLTGIALRYGNLYGPGASDDMVVLIRKRMFPIIGNGAGIWSWTHVEDAAAATVAALEHGTAGVYNIVDDEPAPVSEWLPYLANAVGAKPPFRVPVWLGRLAAGQVPAQWMTEGRGASNKKAKRDLQFRPAWPTWREGFLHLFDRSPVSARAPLAAAPR
jgi:nucleoside-diphosphate-sugar epimerase